MTFNNTETPDVYAKTEFTPAYIGKIVDIFRYVLFKCEFDADGALDVFIDGDIQARDPVYGIVRENLMRCLENRNPAPPKNLYADRPDADPYLEGVKIAASMAALALDLWHTRPNGASHANLLDRMEAITRIWSAENWSSDDILLRANQLRREKHPSIPKYEPAVVTKETAKPSKDDDFVAVLKDLGFTVVTDDDMGGFFEALQQELDAAVHQVDPKVAAALASKDPTKCECGLDYETCVEADCLNVDDEFDLETQKVLQVVLDDFEAVERQARYVGRDADQLRSVLKQLDNVSMALDTASSVLGAKIAKLNTDLRDLTNRLN